MLIRSLDRFVDQFGTQIHVAYQHVNVASAPLKSFPCLDIVELPKLLPEPSSHPVPDVFPGNVLVVRVTPISLIHGKHEIRPIIPFRDSRQDSLVVLCSSPSLTFPLVTP